MVLSKTVEHFGITMDVIIEYNPEINDVELVHNIFVKDEHDNAEVDIADILDAFGGNALKVLINQFDWEEQYKIALSELNAEL
jgi:hypothetical protein